MTLESLALELEQVWQDIEATYGSCHTIDELVVSFGIATCTLEQTRRQQVMEIALRMFLFSEAWFGADSDAAPPWFAFQAWVRYLAHGFIDSSESDIEAF